MEHEITNIKSLFRQNLSLFSALGDPQRQQILLLMADSKKLSVGELTRLTDLSRPAVSHHLKVLREAGLLTQTVDGTKRYYHPTFRTHIEPLRALIDSVDALEK